MPHKFKEEWIVRIGKEAFQLDEKQIIILREAMKRNERWVNFNNFILSIPHIECIYLLSRQEIANQLPEGKKENDQPIAEEKWEELKKKIKEKLYEKK